MIIMGKEKKYPELNYTWLENRQLPLDLTFIVNEPGRTLKDRFKELIKDCSFFDCLVAYFYVSGFHAIYEALEKTDKTRILVGIGTSRSTYDLIKEATYKNLSHYETKQEIINYDIPWNPTRLMQRVGRINRIDTPFDKIYAFNFFPTKQADSEIELTNIARSKIEAFLTLLGGDSAILTEGEPVSSHELFDKLLSKKTISEDEEEESELKYLRFIEEIRDNNRELFERIKRLPKKARSSKTFSEDLKNFATTHSLLTFFRKGRLMKFFLSNKEKIIELDFLSAAKILEGPPDEKRAKLPLANYYEFLDKNKSAFFDATIEEIFETRKRAGRSSYDELLKILKATQKNSKQLTEEQEEYLQKVINRLEEGSLPKKTVQKTLKGLNELKRDIQNPLKVIGVLQSGISLAFLKSHYAKSSAITEGKREVILSLYLDGDEHEKN